MLKRIGAGLGGLVAVAILAVAILLARSWQALAPPQVTTEDRLAQFPTGGMPIEGRVTIRWNDWQVPFIEAEQDDDLAFALGMVHAHLRGAQMEMLRRVATGRLSEMVGPIARDIDHALRVLDFGHAAPAMLAEMPEETRAWLQRFVDGVNHYWSVSDETPPEFGLLGLRPESWTMTDLVTIGRLAGSDVNWIAYFMLLPRRSGEHWAEDWLRALGAGGISLETAAMEDLPEEATRLDAVATLLAGLSRSGSNSFAVAPQRSATGGSLIANDPHLGMFLPNLWLLAGIRSPSYEAVGMMIPGIPIMALGRTPHLAWGGTNLRAASSDLYDVSDWPEERFTTEEQRIRSRFWFGRSITVRRTELGPVITDAPLIDGRPGEALALRWVGHEPTHEMTAFLRALRARTPQAFRRAFEHFGVSAQNMVFASADGDIGTILATQLPIRHWDVPADLVLSGSDPAFRWQGFANATTLPWVLNPESGYIVSANNRPRYTDRNLGYFFTPDDRVDRMEALIEGGGRLGVEDLESIQQDVISEPARHMAHSLAELLREAGTSRAAERLAGQLESWDGAYTVESSGAVAFETLLARVVQSQYGEPGDDGEPTVPSLYSDWAHLQTYLIDDLRALDPEARARLLAAAVPAAQADAENYPTWGDMHRLSVGHALQALPLLGRRFVLEDLPVAGSRETLHKTAHGLVHERHSASYGAQARHISDMSDPDANYFVLLGGNDGWLGSANFADQVALWRRGGYIRMPLTPPAVEEAFPRAIMLTPRP